jgi:hypothetical protein
MLVDNVEPLPIFAWVDVSRPIMLLRAQVDRKKFCGSVLVNIIHEDSIPTTTRMLATFPKSEQMPGAFPDVQMRYKSLFVHVDVKAVSTIEHSRASAIHLSHLLLGNIEYFIGHIANAAIDIEGINPGTMSAGREGVVSVVGDVARRSSYCFLSGQSIN